MRNGNVWYEAACMVFGEEVGDFYYVYAQETPKGEWVLISRRREEIKFLSPQEFHDAYRIVEAANIERCQYLSGYLYRELHGEYRDAEDADDGEGW